MYIFGTRIKVPQPKRPPMPAPDTRFERKVISFIKSKDKTKSRV